VSVVGEVWKWGGCESRLPPGEVSPGAGRRRLLAEDGQGGCKCVCVFDRLWLCDGGSTGLTPKSIYAHTPPDGTATGYNPSYPPSLTMQLGVTQTGGGVARSPDGMHMRLCNGDTIV